MAVPEQTPYKEYTANGVTTSFPLEFDCDNQDHLIVTVNDVEPENGQWSLINGAVVFLLAPANQAKIIIQRNTPFERDTDYQSYNNSFRPQPVNKDFDRIWWKLQELGYRDQVIWLALVKEISDRIVGDKNLQIQIDVIDQQVNENTSDISQLVNDLSREIADRITGDKILKDMFLAMMDEAITEGTINALAITHIDSLSDLGAITNVWEGRTIYVKDSGMYEYDASSLSWSLLEKNIVKTVESVADLQNLVKWGGRTVYVESYNKVLYALAKPIKIGGGFFTYVDELSQVNDYGHIINGWQRLNTKEYRPVNFGAVPDWNSSTQDGTDSTISIQRCINSCLNTENNMRNGGARSIVFDSGNYYFTKLNISRINWFDLTVIGEGMCQFWIKGVGNKDGGIINNLEGTKWKNIIFNGFEGASNIYPPIFGEDDLQYIMQCYLPAPYSLPDIDINFDGCGVFWCKEFALVRGRGFTFRNGDWGGIQGALCVIDCDPSLIFETSNTSKANQWFDTAMRHYRVQNSRGDGSQFVIRVQGTAPYKEYIHDVTVSDCAIVNNEYGIIDAEDARLIAPKLVNNFFTMCRRGYHCKAVVNAVDSGNTWSNNAGTDSSHYDPAIIANGIQNLHIITDSIDGFYIGDGGSYKQISYSLIYLAGSAAKANNIKIKDSFFEDFGDVADATACLVKFENPPEEFKNVEITGNSIRSKNGYVKKWVSHSADLDYTQNGNSTDGNFKDDEMVWRKSSSVNGIIYDYKYVQNGSYIEGITLVNIAASLNSGAVGDIPLPIPAISFNPSLSSQISNVATFGYFENLKTSKMLSAYVTVSSGITLLNVTDGTNLDVSNFTKLDNSKASSMMISYRYRFKM